MTKETLSQKTYPGYFTDPENFSDLIDRYRIYRKKPNLLPENISLTKESIHMDFTITKYSDVSTGDELTIVVQRRDNADFSNKFIYLKKQKCLLKKTESCDGLDWIGYNVSEDSGNTFTPIDGQTFSYLLKNDISLPEIRKRAEIENPQHIFFDKNLWQSLGRGKIPEEFIGRITVDEFESIEASGFNYLDLATKDVIEVEYSLGSSEQSLSTKVGTYYITPCEVQRNTNYFFIPPFINYPRPDKIQLTKDQFFEALKNQQPPLT